MWRRLSIAAKLPLGVVLLLILIGGGILGLAYVQVRTSAVNSANDHLYGAARYIADLLARDQTNAIGQLAGAARNPTIQAFFANPTPTTGADVLSLLKSSRQSAMAGFEFRDVAGTTLLTSGRPFPTVDAAAPHQEWAAGGPAVGEFERDGDGVALTSHVGVRVDGAPAGYIIQRRRSNDSQEFSALARSLLGSDAEVLVGNADGSLWTDFVKPAPPRDVEIGQTHALLRYRRPDGEPVLARMQLVAETPWAVLIEFNEDDVLAPVRRFLRTTLLLSGALVVLGAAISVVASRRITRPIQAITQAAVAVADARPVPRLARTRDDEIGQLATVFNAMADEVAQKRAQLRALVDELEERVRQRTGALEAANRELEAFSYSVSHDLRAPLRAIAGFAQILQEDHADQLTPAARSTLDVIVTRARHMGLLIDDLLAFSRLGRVPLSREPLDLAAIARGAWDEVRRSEPDRVIACTIHPLPPAQGELSLLQQVFVNLLQNAAKFTRTRSPAVIEVGHVMTPEGPACFVRDNGVGFDPRYADKLFGVFQRLHRAEEFEGTGVGLAIVQRIIHRHGGRVWAESELDRGATFYFTLPDGTPAPPPHRVD